MTRPHVVERAFQLAVGCTSIDDVARSLTKEGYSGVLDHLASPSLRAQLKAKLKPGKATTK